jgi:hypothetical protein
MFARHAHTNSNGRFWAAARMVRYMACDLFTTTGIKPQKGGWP